MILEGNEMCEVWRQVWLAWVSKEGMSWECIVEICFMGWMGLLKGQKHCDVVME